jgi:hypothetical protein
VKYATADVEIRVKVRVDIHQGGLDQHTLAHLEENVAERLRDSLEECAERRYGNNHFYRATETTAQVVSSRVEAFPSSPPVSLYDQLRAKLLRTS